MRIFEPIRVFSQSHSSPSRFSVNQIRAHPGVQSITYEPIQVFSQSHSSPSGCSVDWLKNCHKLAESELIFYTFYVSYCILMFINIFVNRAYSIEKQDAMSITVTKIPPEYCVTPTHHTFFIFAFFIYFATCKCCDKLKKRIFKCFDS